MEIKRVNSVMFEVIPLGPAGEQIGGLTAVQADSAAAVLVVLAEEEVLDLAEGVPVAAGRISIDNMSVN